MKGEVVEPGVLYLVATPIGNLGDVTIRALDVLRGVDVIACEDTRRTLKLLNHFEIRKSLMAVPAFDEGRRAGEVVRRLKEGAAVAFVSDAGMPAVSDPGTLLVRAAVAEGLRVIPVPGASASLAALSVSGLDTARFHFLGFLPRKGGDRRRLLAEAASLRGAVVLHEAPGRLAATLRDLAGVCGEDRPAVVCRELTKRHEEVSRGTLSELAARYAGEVLGEITLVVQGATETAAGLTLDEALEQVQARVDAGERLKVACREVAEAAGLSARDLYQAALGRRPPG